jgi:tRNA(fMet)-specific endonuclease VapC
MLYILDTDHLSLYQRGDAKLWSRFALLPPRQIAITVISAEEAIRGRFSRIRAAQTETARIQAYRWLCETLDILKDFTILAYDQSASASYELLRQQKLRVGTQDLRIAAIALAVGATVVTRNQSDFGQVSGLNMEDWTK